MRKILRTSILFCWALTGIILVIGVVSLVALILIGGNYWIAVPITSSAEIPAIFGLVLAVIGYLGNI